MLRNSFCHVPGIGEVFERRLWSLGFDSWDSVVNDSGRKRFLQRFASLDHHLRRSFCELQDGNSSFFSDGLPGDEHWRMFPEFRDSIAYVDIETAGVGSSANTITTIAVYDGRDIRCYVRGRNLKEFAEDIMRYRLIVTYNGKCFDIPVIEKTFGIHIGAAHIDLRYVLNSLGYLGGLKTCEKQFGIDRGELNGVDGFYAVLLWNEYVRKREERVLETLLAYNIEDVVNLETLMIGAYNQKLKGTPFWKSNRQPRATAPTHSYRVDPETLRNIRLTRFFK